MSSVFPVFMKRMKGMAEIGGWRRRFVARVLCWMLFAMAISSNAGTSLSFNQDIRPILSENCFLCHGPDEASRKAKLRLDEPESALADRDGIRAIVPGKPEQSELIRRIDADDLEDRMPPENSGRRLKDAEKAMLKAWIASGAEYERHWAFEPIVRPAVPEISGNLVGHHPIDRFLLARLRERGMEFSPAASRELGFAGRVLISPDCRRRCGRWMRF